MNPASSSVIRSPGARPARDAPTVCDCRSEEGGPSVAVSFLATASHASIQSEYTSTAELRSACRGQHDCAEPLICKKMRIQFVLVWKLWPHDLQLKLPTPIFLSILTLTDVSWLQKTHLKEVASASRCIKCQPSTVMANDAMPYLLLRSFTLCCFAFSLSLISTDASCARRRMLALTILLLVCCCRSFDCCCMRKQRRDEWKLGTTTQRNDAACRK